jgi:hypothetical protein
MRLLESWFKGLLLKRFYCICGQECQYGDVACANCHRLLGFLPSQQKLRSVAHPSEFKFKPCAHREGAMACNWLVEDDHSQCLACRTTRMIPTLDKSINLTRLAKLEATKRRMLYNLLVLGFPLEAWVKDASTPLLFDFLEDQRTNPDVDLQHVSTGHCFGVITIHAGEADDGFLSEMKAQMGEDYRTLLGHFRHEIGHYVWARLFDKEADRRVFRKFFGDETRDYNLALEAYYLEGAQADWAQSFVSAYASSHPLEDWAETWAHYLHITDTLETAMAYHLIDPDTNMTQEDDWYKSWQKVTGILNSLNRSMGLVEGYPFTLPDPVREKIQLIHAWVDANVTHSLDASFAMQLPLTHFND